jgi:hypothetical protein
VFCNSRQQKNNKNRSKIASHLKNSFSSVSLHATEKKKNIKFLLDKFWQVENYFIIFIKIKMPAKTYKKRKSRSTRAGLIFPVARTHGKLKSAPTATARLSQGASVYATAVVEYLVGMYISKRKTYQ